MTYSQAYQKFLVYRSCGCCTTKLNFFSIYGLKEAIKKSGLGTNMAVKDGEGDVHLFINTKEFWTEEYIKGHPYWKWHDSAKEIATP